MFSLSCTGVICVIISRGHYLIDILVAYYVTTRVFWMYHTMAHNQLMMVSARFKTFILKLLTVCNGLLVRKNVLR